LFSKADQTETDTKNYCFFCNKFCGFRCDFFIPGRYEKNEREHIEEKKLVQVY